MRKVKNREKEGSSSYLGTGTGIYCANKHFPPRFHSFLHAPALEKKKCVPPVKKRETEKPENFQMENKQCLFFWLNQVEDCSTTYRKSCSVGKREMTSEAEAVVCVEGRKERRCKGEDNEIGTKTRRRRRKRKRGRQPR